MLKKKFKLSVFKLSLLLTCLFMFLAAVLEYAPERVPFLKSLALKVNSDAQFKLRGARKLAEDIVIVAIDDKSIEKFGRWPWNRTLLAEGLQKMAHAQPKLIAFDMVFSEADPTSKTSDTLFTQTIQTINKNTPVLLGYFFYFSKKDIEELQTNWEEQFQHIFDSKITAKISTVRNPPEQIPTGVGAKSSFEPYAKATRHHGFFDISSDLDGVIRKTHLIGKYQTTLFPSFGLKAAGLALNREIVVQFDEYGIENIFFKNETLPINERGELWINYAGSAKTFPTLSFSDVYSGKITSSHLKDKIILMGVTAKAVGDIKVTPVDSSLPGIEINATIVENLIHKYFLSRPSELFLYELLFIFCVGILFGVLFQKLKSLSSALMTLLLLIIYVVADQKLFFEKGILADLFIPGCHLFFVFITTNAFKYFVEEKKSRQIRDAFQHYVSPAVVNEILKKPDQLALGGEKRKLTVLFSDIRGFTTLSETLPPEKLTRLLNLYLTTMTDCVFEHGGMLDKYVGDELMALFGAPLKTEHHALDACMTALGMIEQLDFVRHEWAKENVSHLNIGIGIHTGEMIVGNMGSERIFDYTVIGDSVNLGSRLEGTNKVYGTHIIVSEDVYTQIQGNLICRELDTIRVRGKQKPILIYEVIGKTASQEQKDLLEHFQKGLSFYRQTQWKEAIHLFEQFPSDGPSRAFLTRCQIYAQNPPPANWDGVFVITEK